MKDQFNNAVGPQIRNGSNGHGNGSSTGRNNFSSKLIPALAVLTMGAGLQAATQFFARSFHYQAALGPHFNFVYPPWAILIWAGKWFKLYPDAFMHAGSIGVIGTGFGMIGLLVARTVSSNSSRTNEYLHGSARWANEVDIRAAGLMPRSRTILDRIIGKEKVEVPAGVFEDCVRVETLTRYVAKGLVDRAVPVTHWYHPKVGLVKAEARTSGGVYSSVLVAEQEVEE